MSGYKTHMLAYALFALGIFVLLREYSLFDVPSDMAAAGVISGLLYSTLPDLDTPSSAIRKAVERTFLAAAILFLAAYLVRPEAYLIYCAMTTLFIVYLLWFVRHRGFFHSIAAGVIFSAPLFFFNAYVGFFALAGFLSHLLVDGKITKML